MILWFVNGQLPSRQTGSRKTGSKIGAVDGFSVLACLVGS